MVSSFFLELFPTTGVTEGTYDTVGVVVVVDLPVLDLDDLVPVSSVLSTLELLLSSTTLELLLSSATLELLPTTVGIIVKVGTDDSVGDNVGSVETDGEIETVGDSVTIALPLLDGCCPTLLDLLPSADLEDLVRYTVGMYVGLPQ